MKKLIISALCLLCMACAKKTYTLDTKTTAQQLAASTNSVAKSSSAVIDKTITVTRRVMDTTLLVGQSSLTGYLKIGNKWGDTSSYIENDDLRLLLSAHNGRVTATATAKPKKIHANYEETKSVFANLTTSTDTKTATKSTARFKADSSAKQSEKVVEGVNLFKFVLPILLALGAVVVIVFLFKRFNIVAKLIK